MNNMSKLQEKVDFEAKQKENLRNFFHLLINN